MAYVCSQGKPPALSVDSRDLARYQLEGETVSQLRENGRARVCGFALAGETAFRVIESAKSDPVPAAIYLKAKSSRRDIGTPLKN